MSRPVNPLSKRSQLGRARLSHYLKQLDIIENCLNLDQPERGHIAAVTILLKLEKNGYQVIPKPGKRGDK